MRRGGSGSSLRGGCRRWRATDEVREALEKAFDYRGDVTVTRKDGKYAVQVSCSIGGVRDDAGDSFVRIVPANEKTR